MFRRVRNAEARDNWLKETLEALPAGTSLLDVGAGECVYKAFCSHLNYVSQDIAEYDGTGNSKGLQTGEWSFARIDMVCDLYDIPEERQYDTVLCTEVLEHVADPVAAIEKLHRLVGPGGTLIVTAPFFSLTHFAPYHYATGFSEYFYQHHLVRLGFDIEYIAPNGGYFDFIDQELGRIRKVRRRYSGFPIDPMSFLLIFLMRIFIRFYSQLDGPRTERNSSELLTFGWHVVARKPDEESRLA